MSAAPPVSSAIPRLATPLHDLPPLLPDELDAGRKATAPAFVGSADSLAIAQMALRASKARQMVAILCADAVSVQRLAEEIAWFAPELRVSVLPDWETLPYDQFSPHQDLVSERLATLTTCRAASATCCSSPPPPPSTA